MTTTTAIAAQAVETACDECAGDGQLAYDLEAAMWYPAAQPRTGPPTTASGSVCSTACYAMAPARCASIRDAVIVRRDPAGNSARAWGSVRRSLSDTWKPEVRLSTAELT